MLRVFVIYVFFVPAAGSFSTFSPCMFRFEFLGLPKKKVLSFLPFIFYLPVQGFWYFELKIALGSKERCTT